jgi:hypothetical protein
MILSSIIMQSGVSIEEKEKKDRKRPFKTTVYDVQLLLL